MGLMLVITYKKNVIVENKQQTYDINRMVNRRNA
jgi:hypothetical protein